VLWSVRSVLLTLACAVVAGGCQSSSSSTTSARTTSAQATAAAIAGQLSRLSKPLRMSSVRLPTPSTKPAVEREFLIVAFDDAQTTWRHDFAAAGLDYRPARLVVYWSEIESACDKTDDPVPAIVLATGRSISIFGSSPCSCTGSEYAVWRRRTSSGTRSATTSRGC
jgi:hypothetical protein